MPCYTTWSRVKVKTQRSVTCNLMKKGGAADGGVGFWRCTLQQTKSYLSPPLSSFFPPLKLLDPPLQNVLLLRRFKSIANSLSPSP